MSQWPFQIAKHVGDIKQIGRGLQGPKETGGVYQDVYFTDRGHISRLPDEILECILNKLKLRDAVRAGLVSSRWRHLVLSRACLVLDVSNMFEIKNCDLQVASTKKCVCLEYKDQFVRAVYQFLASYRGTRMNKFALHFCLKIESKYDLYNWIHSALGLGVEVLDLELCCQHFKYEKSFRWKLPIDFYASGRPVVKDLGLSYCDAPELFPCNLFSQLESLKFHQVCFRFREMEWVLSSLVSLKNLEMKECELPPYLSLNCLTSLEGAMVLFCTGLEKIDVASLKLKRLKVLCKRTVSLDLTGVPNLKVLGYAVCHHRGMQHIFSKLPELVPRLRILRVDSHSNLIEDMPESMGTFSRLRGLVVSLNHKVGDIMSKLVQLLKLCPLLCELNIPLSGEEDKEHEELESIEDYRHEHLKWITITGFVGTKYQIECCKYLLKLAPRKRELALMCDPPIPISRVLEASGYRSSHPLSEEERESVINTLKAFSNGAKVFFVKKSLHGIHRLSRTLPPSI